MFELTLEKAKLAQYAVREHIKTLQGRNITIQVLQQFLQELDAFVDEQEND